MCILNQLNHLRQRIVCQAEHLMDMFILVFGEVDTSRAFVVDGTGQIIAAVADTLYLSHFTKHLLNLQLTFRTQASFRYLIQVIGYLYLHVVTDIFILLYPAEQLVEVVLILGMQQIPYHPEHTLDTFGKKIDFLSGLQDRKFSCRQQTSIDELQPVFFLLFLLRNNLAYGLFDEMDKPDKNQNIAYIEASMESRQLERNRNSFGFADVHHV